MSVHMYAHGSWSRAVPFWREPPWPARQLEHSLTVVERASLARTNQTYRTWDSRRHPVALAKLRIGHCANTVTINTVTIHTPISQIKCVLSAGLFYHISHHIISYQIKVSHINIISVSYIMAFILMARPCSFSSQPTFLYLLHAKCDEMHFLLPCSTFVTRRKILLDDLEFSREYKKW